MYSSSASITAELDINCGLGSILIVTGKTPKTPPNSYIPGSCTVACTTTDPASRINWPAPGTLPPSLISHLPSGGSWSLYQSSL